MNNCRLTFTICSNNYLPQAKTLGESFLELHPDFRFVIILADTYHPQIDYTGFGDIEIISVADADITDVMYLSQKYNIIEFCTALKPSCFKYFIKQCIGLEEIYYVDPDLFFYQQIIDAQQAINSGSSMVLTPHVITPLPLDGFKPDENTFLNYGIYNLGFLGINPKHWQIEVFLSWWEERVKIAGYNWVSEGQFTDQLWMNLAPLFFEDALILKNLGYNMAPWNLHERKVILSDDGIPKLESGDSVVFYHFSRYRFTETEDEITYYNRYPLATLPILHDLYIQYKQRLLANHYIEWHQITAEFGKSVIAGNQTTTAFLKNLKNRIVNHLNKF